MTTTDTAPVTQADRDAVQAFHRTMLDRLMSDIKSERPRMGEDEGDAGTLVQAFARHRLATESRLAATEGGEVEALPRGRNCQTVFTSTQQQRKPNDNNGGPTCPYCKAHGQYTYPYALHEGYPCKGCGIAHDAVPPGACAALASQPNPATGTMPDGAALLTTAAQIAGDAYWNLPVPKFWDRDKAEYFKWCARQSAFVREKITDLERPSAPLTALAQARPAVDREDGEAIASAHSMLDARGVQKVADIGYGVQRDLSLIERLVFALSPPAAKVEDYTRQRVAEVMEDGGFWLACSGCQESSDGCVSTTDYPYSPTFKCQPGGGCSECGGIGVIWDDGRGYENISAARAALGDKA